MSTRAVVLGCGLVGATIARDLADDADVDVLAVDVSADNLARLAQTARVRTLRADLSDRRAVAEAIKESDVVLGALPSRIGLQTLETVIRSGKGYCDISFMPEDATELHALAKENKVTAVVDCGVSPGLSNVMIGHAATQFDRMDRAEIYVGGLPRTRRWPYEYKAPFAPSDVIEEYVRPARLVENGQVVVKGALSEAELMDFPGIGTLEAFNTDGLRSLLKTVQVKNMREKTLRYPGHCELMRVLRETGYFGTEPIDVKGVSVIPREVTAKLLFPLWAGAANEEEFTVLRVLVEGERGVERRRMVFDLHDETDRRSGSSSMARTTGFPCAIVGRMIAAGELREPGVHPPEVLARKPGFFEKMTEALRRRGVFIRHLNELVSTKRGVA